MVESENYTNKYRKSLYLFVKDSEYNGTKTLQSLVEYASKRMTEESEKDRLIYYITDALMYITENTANQRGGKAISKRFYDLKNDEPEETRTPDEIINSIKNKLGK